METDKTAYVLISAVKNEARCIKACMDSILKQRPLPIKWVIVSDGSTDETDRIVQDYAKRNPFITYVRREPQKGVKGFASKVMALKMGFEHIGSIDYEYIGHLDGDITFPDQYYAKVFQQFRENPRLGLGGGFLLERFNGRFQSRPLNTAISIPGGIQVFKRACYLDIGGLNPIPFGGEDWYCEIKARMLGWEVQSFERCTAHHHRSGFSRRGSANEAIRGGTIDYFMGTHPFFLLMKCIRRARVRPYLLFSLLWFFGYVKSFLKREAHYVEPKVRSYLKKEQLERLRAFFLEKVAAK